MVDAVLSVEVKTELQLTRRGPRRAKRLGRVKRGAHRALEYFLGGISVMIARV